MLVGLATMKEGVGKQDGTQKQETLQLILAGMRCYSCEATRQTLCAKAAHLKLWWHAKTLREFYGLHITCRVLYERTGFVITS